MPKLDERPVIDVLNRWVFWSFPLVALVLIAIALADLLAVRRSAKPAA